MISDAIFKFLKLKEEIFEPQEGFASLKRNGNLSKQEDWVGGEDWVTHSPHTSWVLDLFPCLTFIGKVGSCLPAPGGFQGCILANLYTLLSPIHSTKHPYMTDMVQCSFITSVSAMLKTLKVYKICQAPPILDKITFIANGFVKSGLPCRSITGCVTVRL